MGGYGVAYVRALLNLREESGMRFIAAADPAPSGCELLPDVEARRIPIFPSLEALLDKQNPDLIVLATPPQVHAEQVVLALEHGHHVLCEKPVACDPHQVQRMIQARDRARKVVAVGYQWSFSPAILRMKSDLMAGRFGKPKKLRTLVLWPRDERYYARNDWAGRQRDSKGRLVLDSPVNNACSHFLHNMFFVLGPKIDRSDLPMQVEAELYRANRIDNYDTAVIRCVNRSGAELLFIASHATEKSNGPLIEYQFELGMIQFGGEENPEMIGRLSDGSIIRYGKPPDAATDEKLKVVCTAIREGKPIVCGLEASASQNTCMFAAQQSMPLISRFPEDMVVTEGEIGKRVTYARGLDSALNDSYKNFKLPSEMHFNWARPGKVQTIGQE